MIYLSQGDNPKFTTERVPLPFTGVDIGQIFDMKAQVKLDAINPEGPTFVIEVMAIEFPGRNEGTIEGRKEERQVKAGTPPTKKKNG